MIDGQLVMDGATVVADTVPGTEDASARPVVRYQVLCRAHHRSGQLGPDGAAD